MNVFGNYLLPHDAGTLFDDAALCRAMLDFESALAMAQVHEGVIPAPAGQAIAAACASLELDPAELVEAGRHSGAMAIPLVTAIARALQTTAPDAVCHLHYGATTQDVVDTAQVLMTRHACTRLLAELDACIDLLLPMAEQHRLTPMLARTLMQPAQVTSWGLKCAQWAQPLRRSREQLHALSTRALVLQLGGAVGNRSTLGEAGDRVAARMAAQLQLGCPDSGWHTQRDAWMRLGMEVAVLAGSLSKIARDLALLSQAEVGEVYAQDAQRGGSSAMPHKRNPVACMQAVAASIQVPHLAATLLSTMAQAHERALGEWQAEVAVWPQLWVQAFAATGAIRSALEGLHVDTDRMAHNIDQLQGVVYSEPIAHALAPLLGKPQASALVRMLGAKALQNQVPLIELVLDDEALGGLTAAQRDELNALCKLQAAVAPSAHLCDTLQQMACPTLVMAGALDAGAPPAMPQAIANPDAQPAVIEQASHTSAIEQPREFARSLEAFVSERMVEGEGASHGTPSPSIDYERGLLQRRRVLGDAWVDRSLAQRTSFNAEFQDLITRHAWNDIWGRPALGDRTRRFMVLSLMLGLKAWEEFALHVRAALDATDESRLSPDDLKEAILMAAVYCGVPAANHAFAVAGALLKERGLVVPLGFKAADGTS